MDKMMTLQEAAQIAIDVQDACNLSGVLHAFDRVIDAIWAEARATNQGTDFVNHHAICTLFLSKLTDLNGRESEFFKACGEVEQMTEGPSR